MKYYVYGLVDPRDNKIKYIGKGCGNRMFLHVKYAKTDKDVSHNFNKLTELKEILGAGYEDIAYCKLYETNDENEAYYQETAFIDQYHTLAPNGWNLNRGGLGGFSPTEEALEKRRNSLKGHIVSQETRQKISKSNKGKSKGQGQRWSGEEHPWIGKQHSESSKKKMSLAKIGKKLSQETKQKLSERSSGSGNPRYGVIVSEETKQKMSESLKGRKSWNKDQKGVIKHSEETKKKMSESTKRYWAIKKGLINE